MVGEVWADQCFFPVIKLVSVELWLLRVNWPPLEMVRIFRLAFGTRPCLVRTVVVKG